MRTRSTLATATLLAYGVLHGTSLVRAQVVAARRLPATTSAQATKAPATASDSPAGAPIDVMIYDPDPEHLWNRLHRALWVRVGPDGKSYGHDRLDPLLWKDTKYLIEGKPHERSIAVLDEFLAKEGEKLIENPLKRAILQRDLWTVFDWAAEPGTNGAKADSRRAATPRRALQRRLARTIRRLALTADQIKALPDNYAAAVATHAFAEKHDPDHPERSFLPLDVFQKDGPWVEVEIDNGSAVTASRHVHDFGARSAFRVFLRLPEGRKAAIAYFEKLRDFPRPWVNADKPDRDEDKLTLNTELPHFPVGTQTALIRQMLLVDKDGRIATTRVTESVQIRVYRAIPRLMPERTRRSRTYGEQDVYEILRSRGLLFAQKHGGLRPPGLADKDFRTQLMVHSFDPFELPPDDAPFERRMSQTNLTCIGCHDQAGIYSVQSYVRSVSRARGQYYLPVLQENENADWQGELTGWLKRREYSWGLLQGLWEAQPGK
jgi:hypothetical protein